MPLDGACAVPAITQKPCPADVDHYARLLATLFPPGLAFYSVDWAGSVQYGRVRSMAAALADLDAEACSLLPEFRCQTVDRTRESWMVDYGLPDDCGINDLCVKVTSIGDGTCASLVEIGAALGFDMCCEEIAPEIQPGCWNLGCDQMPPAVEWKGGGSELGFAGLPCVANNFDGNGLGVETMAGDCDVAGYFVRPPTPETMPNPCVYEVVQCRAYERPLMGELLVGCRAPWSCADYVGTAYHFITGLRSDQEGVIGFRAYCKEDFGLGANHSGDGLGAEGLGEHVPMTNVPMPWAIMGCWEVGCTSLCSPPVNEVLCFVLKLRPAHTVPIRRYC